MSLINKLTSIILIFYSQIWPCCSDSIRECYSPLKYFTHCISSEHNHRLNGILLERNDKHKQIISQCFRDHDCGDIDLSSTSVDVYLNGEWRSRVETLLNMLESTPEDVQDCMLKYVKQVIQRQLQQCVRDFGTPDLHNFTMPQIGGFDQFDVVAAKDVIQYRMLIRYGLVKCTKKDGGRDVKGLVQCISNARTKFKRSMCQVRNECKKVWMDASSCGDHFAKVHQAACDCRNEERSQLSQKGVFGYIHRLHSLVQKFDRLNFEDNYKICFEKNNRVFPAEKFEIMKKVIAKSVADIILFKKKIPRSVKYTLKVAQAVLSNLGENWKASFCTKCTSSVEDFDDSEIHKLKKIITDSTRQKYPVAPTTPVPLFYNLFKGISSFIRIT